MSTISIGNYLIERLHAQGVDDIFGVPGDFVLRFMQQIEESQLRLINTCDEQGAGFAADAYARMRGLGVVCVTYGVGGLNVTNTTGQAYAEESPVVVISGAPSLAERRSHPLIHHKVRSYDTQYRVFQHLTVTSTVLDDAESACREIDRVLGAAIRNSRPVYIEIPRDMVDIEVSRPATPAVRQISSDPRTLAAAVSEATERINNARQPVLAFGVEFYRFGLEEQAMKLVNATNIPTTVTLLDKATIQEAHPTYIGVYAGALGRSDVREYVESSDCLILLGTLLTDVNLGIFTAQLDPARCIHATHDRLAVGLHTFENVTLQDFVAALADAPIAPRAALGQLPEHPQDVTPTIPLDANSGITIAALLNRIVEEITPETVILADPGDAMFASIDLPVTGARAFVANAFYTSLGFAVPAAIGVQVARPETRPLVLVGDGAFQMTGVELSTCALFGLDPLVIVLNNAGYTTERLILDGKFNDILPWDFSKVPDMFGGKGRSRVVTTVGELDSALTESRQRDGQFFLIDIRLDPRDVSPALRRLGERLNAAATTGV